MKGGKFSHVHLIGIGGIHMSAVAKLLKHAGIAVSGSDVAESAMTQELLKRGIPVMIGHAANRVPPETDLVVYSSAVPASNPERVEAERRNIRQQTNFEFLGEWTKEAQTIVVTGTHGKSTTTAMLSLMLLQGKKNPSVVIGSRVPFFADGNIRFGSDDLYVLEGDEYARHFLSFHPYGLIINNIELDHTDIFPTIESLVDTFRELLRQVRDNGFVVANADDPRVETLIGEERESLQARGIHIFKFGFGAHADVGITDYASKPGEQVFVLRDERGTLTRLSLLVPGRMNVMNAAAAAAMAMHLGISIEDVRKALTTYRGIWRRFEKVGERDGITVISDYGHHPTAVRVNLDASKSFFPGKRIILCYQPHHRNRTKALFADFISAFDKADAVILVEIYDVAGRDASPDQDVSSRDLQEAVLKHDADRGVNRPVEYASTPTDALGLLRRWRKTNDLIIVMGAGDIYQIATKVLM